MRKFVLAAAIAAALTAPVQAGDDYVYNWTGAYAGLHAGYAWGDASVVDTDGGVPYGAFDYSASGALGGATLGANYQIDGLVVGIEGDLGYMNLNGDRFIASSSPGHHQDLTLDGGVYGDLTGRLGVALGRTLFYGKAGVAFYDGEAKQQTTKDWYTATGTDTFTGFVYGGGIEHALGDGWSLKLEYLHYDFGSQGGAQTKSSSVGADDPGTPVGYVFHNEHSLESDSVKLGVNYRF